MREIMGGWEHGLSPETINNFRQNTPELVIRDARRLLDLDDNDCQVLRQILLARGINKWLKARRDIIRLKEKYKTRIKELALSYRKYRPEDKIAMRLLQEFRACLRKICHSPRWVEWPEIADASKAEMEISICGPTA